MEHRRLLGCHKNSVVDIKGEAFHIKGIENIINKIINKIPPNLQKEMPMQVYEEYRSPNMQDQKINIYISYCSQNTKYRMKNGY